jgi:PAS domain S-box-containing protein
VSSPDLSLLETRILVLAPTGRDAELTCAFLEQAGMQAVSCAEMEMLAAEMDKGCAAVILAEEALGPESVQRLIGQLSRQPSWSEIPLCVITSGGKNSADALRTLITSHSSGNVTVLERPFRAATLVNASQVVFGSRLRQYQVRDLLLEREAILASIEDAFVTLDSDWRYTYVNAKAAELAGRAIPEMIGRTLWEIQPSLCGSDVEKQLRDAMAGQQLVTLEYLQRSSGRWFYQRVYPSAHGVSIFTADLTERKKVETDLAEAQRELGVYARSLEHLVHQRTTSLQETNAQLEAFCYTIAHDLRSPLRAQQGFASALLEEYGERLDKTGRLYAERIILAATRLDRLVMDLLAYARVSRTEVSVQPVSLQAVVGEVCEEMDADLCDDVLQLGMLDFTVQGHAVSLKAALTNLLSNALKFTRPGQAARITLEAEESAGWIRIWVRDNGIGIAPEHRDQIFGIFNRLHKTGMYPGTGVGLAIVHKAVERMGGRVGVVSAEGSGSEFWIDLKRGEAEAGPGR